MNAPVAAKSGPRAAVEPIFVFGSNMLGEHLEGHAQIAARFHQAAAGEWDGRTGHAYAIPYRDRELKLMSLADIAGHVERFKAYAGAQRALTLQVMRFACEKGAFDDADIANLFRDAPPNVVLPALWQRLLDPQRPVRIMVYDPAGRLLAAEWQALLGRHLQIKLPLWGASGVELISAGAARGVVATDAAARHLGLKHRVIGENPAYFGAQSPMAAELKAVWSATHLLSITDPDQTAQPAHVRVLSYATRGGLDCDDLYPGIHD